MEIHHISCRQTERRLSALQRSEDAAGLYSQCIAVNMFLLAKKAKHRRQERQSAADEQATNTGSDTGGSLCPAQLVTLVTAVRVA